MGKNIERAYLMSYIDYADHFLRKAIDVNLANGAMLLTDQESEDIHEFNRLLGSIIVRLHKEMFKEDPTHIFPNLGDDR